MSFRALIIAAMVAFSPVASAADPITMLLLQMLGSKVFNSAVESINNPAREALAPSGATRAQQDPPGATEQERLKALIDSSFAHLTADQREAVHASLIKMLNDPQNAPARAAILAQFTMQAKMYRDSHRALGNLSYPDKQYVAAQARDQFRKLPGPQRQEILGALEAGIPGLPRDLGDMMLAEFRSVAAQPESSRSP